MSYNRKWPQRIKDYDLVKGKGHFTFDALSLEWNVEDKWHTDRIVGSMGGIGIVKGRIYLKQGEAFIDYEFLYPTGTGIYKEGTDSMTRFMTMMSGIEFSYDIEKVQHGKKGSGRRSHDTNYRNFKITKRKDK